MNEKSETSQPVSLATTEITTAQLMTKGQIPEVLRKAESRVSTLPGRQTMNSIFRISRSANKIHQIVHPASADWDDDNDDLDDENSEDNESEDDDYVEDIREGDEPLSKQECDQLVSHHHNDTLHDVTSHSNAADEFDGMDHLIPLKEARDKNAVRYMMLPERIEPGSLATSNSVTIGEQAGGKAGPHSRTLKEGAPVPEKVTPISKLEPNITTNQPAQSTTKTSVPLASTSSSDLGAEKRTTQAQAKVDPLAPTAAAPYGYKIVTVKKPDGTIAKVKRPLKEAETAQIPVNKTFPMRDKAVTRPSTQKGATTDSPEVTSSTHESAALSSPSVAPQSISFSEDIEAASSFHSQPVETKENYSKTTKPSHTPKKQIMEQSEVQVTEKELEQADSPYSSALAQDEHFRSAHIVAKIAKLIVWIIGIMLPLFFLGKQQNNVTSA